MTSRAGSSGLPLQHLILNLLLLLGVVSGFFFLLLDNILAPSWAHVFFDVVMMLLFGGLYRLARHRGYDKVVAHLGSVLGIVFTVADFYMNAGTQGSAWMVTLTLLSLIVILHRTFFGALYVLVGCILFGVSLTIERLHPEWITRYASPEAQLYDLGFTFLFCIAVLFVVITMLLRYYQRSLEQNRQDVERLADAEKMATLGELFANLNHEISNPLAVLGSSLDASRDWWKDRFPQAFAVVSGLSPQQRQAFWNLIAAPADLGSQPKPNQGELRSLGKNLTTDLTNRGWEEAQELAANLVAVDLVEWKPEWDVLASDEAGRAAFAFAVSFLELRQSNRISHSAYEKLLSLVQALGEYSRTGRKEQKTVLTGVADGLNTVLVLYGATMKHSVEVIRSFVPVPPIWARPDELIQVWSNLIKNALQAMDHRGVLTVTVEPAEAGVQVRISDNGPGVPDALKKAIFEPFYTTKARGIGTGLGLSISARIIKEHKGTIQVRDALGSGAEFVVYLPFGSENSEPSS